MASARARLAPRPHRLALESLEPREVPTTRLILDFGLGIGMTGALNETVAGLRDIFGGDTGTDMTAGTDAFPAGLDGGDSLVLTPLQYDFDLSGTRNNADLTALANAVVPLVQRALEPFDIDVVVAGSATFADAAALVAGGVGASPGQFDAYVWVTNVTSNGFASGSTSVGVQFSLFGRAAGNDLDDQDGNDTDEAALTFADVVFNDTDGIQGTAVFNQNLAQRLAYTATHEGFHTFTAIHTNGLTASGDVIRVGSNTRQSPFIVTRFDLAHDATQVPPNNYLMIANDPDIGLRDANANGRPDLGYVTGTGAHDQVVLANSGGGVVGVTVNAFSDAARTAAIASESYSINLGTETDGTVLVDASINDDEVQLNAAIAATLRLRAGEGIDGIMAENDLLTLNSGAVGGAYTPGAAEAGTVVYAGGSTVNFSEFENVEADNVPVVVNPLGLSSTLINENDSITLNGSFVAIDTLDTHSVLINWGDGTSTPLTRPAGQRTFSASHQYLDDNPTNTAQDNYTITVTVTDQDADTGTNQAVVTVRNVAPAITSHTNSADSGSDVAEGAPVTVSGAFTDVGTLDTHTVSINWGDGAVTGGTVVQGAGSGTFSGSHAYASGGIFTVTITLTDDDTGADTELETVFITGAGVQTIDGKQVLFVVGSNQGDQVHVNTLADGQVRVHANFLAGGFRDFAQPIDQVRFFLRGGDDTGTIAGNVNIPAHLDGGAGNDKLGAGGAGAVLFGREGDDLLVGGTANDVLIGGDGIDRLVGNRGSDVLIGGLVTYEGGGDGAVLAQQAALLSILAEWNSDRDLDARQANIAGTGAGLRLNGTNFLVAGVTVLDDGDADRLTGSAGTDWFFQYALDTVTDYHDGDEFLN